MTAEKFNRLLVELRDEKETVRRAAISEIYEYVGPKVVIRLRKEYPHFDKNDALDYVHDLFERLIKAKITYRVDTPVDWAFSACVNIIKDKFRLKMGPKNQVPYPEHIDFAAPFSDPFDILVYKECLEKINKCDEITRNIILLHLIDGYTLKEVAERLKMNYGNVRQIYSRGIHDIRKKEKYL